MASMCYKLEATSKSPVKHILRKFEMTTNGKNANQGSTPSLCATTVCIKPPLKQPYPTDPGKQKELDDTHFNYIQVIEEVIYAMVPCRPDISFAVIKLSQYSANPDGIYYKAAHQLLKYLAFTKTRGITYWRQQLLPSIQATQRILVYPDLKSCTPYHIMHQ